MTSASSTPQSWDERYRRLGIARPDLGAVVHSIDIEYLVVGDQILISGEPCVVTHCEPDGPLLIVEAMRGNRTIRNEYLLIERVQVLDPRPPAADRKAYA